MNYQTDESRNVGDEVTSLYSIGERGVIRLKKLETPHVVSYARIIFSFVSLVFFAVCHSDFAKP